MALDFTDLLPTPEGYATPEQIAAARALFGGMQQGKEKGQITHPMQTVGNIFQSLAGGLGMNQAANMERAARERAANNSLIEAPGGVSAPPAVPPVGNKPVGGVPPASGLSFAGMPDEYVNKIKQYEGFTPQAKWDVKQHSIGYGTKGAPGQTMTREEADVALNTELNRAAAIVDKVNPNLTPGTRAALISLTHNTGSAWVNSGLGKAVKAGDEAAAKAAFAQYVNVAGTPNKGIINRRNDELRTMWGQGAPAASGPQNFGGPLAFNGEPTNVPQAGSSPTMVDALAAGGLGGATPALPKTTPVGDTGTPPPGAFNGRPTISRQQMHDILANPWIPQANKDAYQQLYLQQNQPSELAGTGGKWLMTKDGQMHFVPDLIKVPTEAQGVRTDLFRTFDPRTQSFKSIPLQGQTPAATPAPTQPRSEAPDIPYAPREEGGKGMLSGLPPEITQGFSIPAAPKTEGGIPTAPGGDALPLTAPEGDVAAPKAGATGKSAQIDPEIDNLAQYGLQLKRTEEANKKEADDFQKKYTNLTEAGQAGASAIPMLQAARQITLNPNYYSGIGSGMVLDWKKIKAAVGVDPAAATAMEAFDKIMSGQLLKNMRTELHGLGQVRVAELDLLQRAAASGNMTPAANRLVIDLTIKALDKAQKVGELTTRYAQGYRYKWNPEAERPDGEKGAFQAIRDKNGQQVIEKGPHSLSGLDAHINEYLKQSPILSSKERTELTELINNPSGYGGPPARRGKYGTKQPEPPKAEAPKTPRTFDVEPPPFGRK